MRLIDANTREQLCDCSTLHCSWREPCEPVSYVDLSAHWRCLRYLEYCRPMIIMTQIYIPDDMPEYGSLSAAVHDDVIKWKHFQRYWSFVRRIHRWPVNSPHKGQSRGALMFSLICAWINVWVNNREAGDLRRHHAHYDVIVISKKYTQCHRSTFQVIIPWQRIFWTTNRCRLPRSNTRWELAQIWHIHRFPPRRPTNYMTVILEIKYIIKLEILSKLLIWFVIARVIYSKLLNHLSFAPQTFPLFTPRSVRADTKRCLVKLFHPCWIHVSTRAVHPNT